ncbi:hypothetical protein [Spirosoma sp. KUDC1026]|uniref:hypothetical protein n=1 Tax=Spirosoma sp. KUDC1026 TaxID=2745947 RepID=UPI00159BDA4B|nr:hypothetical protein [Spirosoma sp. KUDC1026]QKZ14785.1 hypothetical protein HU175_20010 [Spirosoma sp. KUDC1026]
MQALDKETFSYWVTHPDDLTPTDFSQLQDSIQTYPYCQALYTLTAKVASAHIRPQAVSSIRQAAVHALSRNALRKLIDNEFQWSENLLSKLNELAAGHVAIPDDYQQESYALFKAKTGLNATIPRLTLLQLPSYFTAAEPQTVPQPEDPTLTETQLQEGLSQIVAVEPAPSEPDLLAQQRQQQFDLIDSFIKAEPSISRVGLKSGESFNQEDLTKRNQPATNGLVTETFAKILLKQGKTDKAIEIYQQLIVKSPAKKAYFAAKISEIEAARTSSGN